MQHEYYIDRGGIFMEDTYRNFNIYIGKRIFETRVSHHFTREYLAELADISPKFLYEIENGKKGCSSYILHRIATGLKVSPSYLMIDNQNNVTYEINPVFTYLNDDYKKMINEIIQLLYEKF